jgi:hypothetical protein
MYTSDEMIELIKKNRNSLDKLILDFKVVGTTFIPESQRILGCLAPLPPNTILIDLEREPDNPYDFYAVKVIIGVKGKKSKYHIGYVSRETSKFFSYVLDGSEFGISICSITFSGGGTLNYGLKTFYKIFNK